MTPWAEQLWGVPAAIWIGTLSCVASFLAAILLTCIIDDPSQPALTLKAEEMDIAPLLSSDPREDLSLASTSVSPAIGVDVPSRSTTPGLAQPVQSQGDPQQPSILHHLPKMLRREASFVDSIHSVRFSPGLAKSGTGPSLYIQTDQKQSNQQRCSKVWRWMEQRWDDLKFFPVSFWLLCTLTVLLYGTVVPFNNIASDFLQSKWYHGNPRKAAAVMGIPDTIGAILVPIFGMVVDRFGKRASTLIGAAFIIVIVHSMLGFTMLNPIFAFLLLGIAYTMYGVALWPSIAW